MASSSSLNGRIQSRSKRPYAPPLPRASTSKSIDVYSQFVKRYRSTGPGELEDPRNDPDSHFMQRGLGQLADGGGDSDDDDFSRISLTNGPDGVDRISLMLEEPMEAVTGEEKERLNWQIYFASVLGGDVLRSEKSRIAVALESAGDDQNNPHLSLWYGIRAKFHGRTVEEEKKVLEERRLRIVDSVIKEINEFRLPDGDASQALSQVQSVLRRLDTTYSLYPNLKAFYLDKPAATESVFQARCDTLNTWSTLLSSLRHQVAVLRRWTGSETLDVTQPNTSAEVPINPNNRFTRNGQPETADGSSFAERMLKEESMQRMFEKGSLTTSHACVAAARDAQVNLAGLFEEMNLPSFESELIPLISFPTKLAQACLHLRLAYVKKIKDPEMLIIDQMIDDLKIGIGLACTLKRQYEAFLAPDPGGKWVLPQCISEDYDQSILDALEMFFRLIHWKLKGGAKGIYFKETDVLDAQWATLNDVSMTVSGGSCLVAEQLCSLTNRLMVRVINYFDTQVKVPEIEKDKNQNHRSKRRVANGTANGNGNAKSEFEEQMENPSNTNTMSDEHKMSWYGKILDSVRLRYRKLLRFARVITHRFSDSAEYSLESVHLDQFIDCLVATDHFLVYTNTYEEDGVYIVASASLSGRFGAIQRMLTEAFHVEELTLDDGTQVADNAEYVGTEYDEAQYLLVLSPRHQFTWRGRVMITRLPKVELDCRNDRVRLIADGPQHRLALAKQVFADSFLPVDESGTPIETNIHPLTCLTDSQSHLPTVNRELRKIARATIRLAESIVDSVHHVRASMKMSKGCQELMENWFQFASEHGQHAQKFMDRSSLFRFNRLLTKLAIAWVAFICDDCHPSDRKTFKWAVNALEFAFQRTKRNILHLPEEQFQVLRHKVGVCITLLMGHFDILGARSSLEALKEKERQEQQRQTNAELPQSVKEEEIEGADELSLPDSGARQFWERVSQSVQELESQRVVVGNEFRILGRVLDTEKLEDRSLVFLASSTSNISIRWQQGRFIGAGAFGSVYVGVNLDTGSLMAVKEIKFQELSGISNLYSQIRDELSVMEMLHHPNIVEYYGIEVHRDKVYIFEEYCQGGSIAALLEHGRIEDERITQVYTMQMLEGLAYLHSQGIVHRDIKPDNILLDHLGVIKFVDFGAAKILAKNQRSMARSRRGAETVSTSTPSMGGGVNNSLTGTPMYMSPEIIKNDRRGRHGAMDIWSLGCVVLEFATGKKPWNNLDNEWAIMFHIGVATQHPPLPEPGQLSSLGINFIKQCLTIDPMKRPTAMELMQHPWMIDFKELLAHYAEEEIANNLPVEMPPEEHFENASVARQAAIMQEKEVEEIRQPSPGSELITISDTDEPPVSPPVPPPESPES
ncbi:Pkinase-domain-containing protein [Dendrothele bispora CBS 962.96]|uniref:Pkinase-domain-containing protein n=2 Tax=Dendrothele bispora (strain CBS 962.96) TaxID=1314807 RepID=A0A4S8LRL7_DENBC|nr:Pkinase-domain-containing protein [Dendrothele bispora CBS 962.96]